MSRSIRILPTSSKRHSLFGLHETAHTHQWRKPILLLPMGLGSYKALGLVDLLKTFGALSKPQDTISSTLARSSDENKTHHPSKSSSQSRGLPTICICRYAANKVKHTWFRCSWRFVCCVFVLASSIGRMCFGNCDGWPGVQASFFLVRHGTITSCSSLLATFLHVGTIGEHRMWKGLPADGLARFQFLEAAVFTPW